MGYQGVDVPGGYEEGEAGLAEAGKILFCAFVPAGLGEDGYDEAGVLENAGDYRGAEGGVIDVSIAGDVDEVGL